MALGIGVGAGLGSIAFRWLIESFTELFSGHADYAAAGGSAHPHVPWLGPYFVLITPVI
ncbi:chloride channel protein, partial [Streptomyces sp. SID5785]|nr:chloride channel protein [Streptomyces sp. SID5785]